MADLDIKISDLRTRITFQSPTLNNSAGKFQTEVYANISTNPTVWARWINAHGPEVVSSQALQSRQRATVTVRHRTDIVPTWRILKDGEAWQIISVDAVRDANRWVEMIVERAEGSV
jgi:SPP1 family predicted phage head-tail adaptor